MYERRVRDTISSLDSILQPLLPLEVQSFPAQDGEFLPHLAVV